MDKKLFAKIGISVVMFIPLMYGYYTTFITKIDAFFWYPLAVMFVVIFLIWVWWKL